MVPPKPIFYNPTHFFQQDKQEVVEYYIAFGSGGDTTKNVVNMRS